MSSTIPTYADAVEHLIDYGHCVRGTPQHRHARRAVANSLSRLCALHDWSLYRKQVTVTTTGTLTGVAEVTTADATSLAYRADGWPAWIESSRIRISQAWIDAGNVIGDTDLQLDGPLPGDGDYTFTAVLDRYDLPADFAAVQSVEDLSDGCPLSPARRGEEESEYNRTGTPTCFDVRGAGEYYGIDSLIFIPAPCGERNYLIRYRSAPRRLRLDALPCDVRIDPDDDVCLRTDGEWPERIAGAVVRVGLAGEPTAWAGGGTLGSDRIEVAAVERTVIGRLSATELRLDAPVPLGIEGPAIVSDPVDVAPGMMWVAFLRLAEEEYLRLTGAGESRIAVATKAAMRAVQEARSADAKRDVRPSASHVRYRNYGSSLS